MFKNLTPRAAAALAVVAVSFFLMVIVARYGGAEFANARAAPSAGFAVHLSGWLVQNVGAGIWVLLLLPMAWGAIVYFDNTAKVFTTVSTANFRAGVAVVAVGAGAGEIIGVVRLNGIGVTAVGGAAP